MYPKFASRNFALSPVRAVYIASVIAVGLYSGNAISGEYYKWVDENGVTHFSATPPVAGQSEKKKTRFQKPAVEDVPDKDDTEQNDEKQEPKNEPKVAQKPEPPKDPNLDPARCAAEKARIQSLQSKRRIKLKKADGSFEYLDETGIGREIQRSKKVMEIVCG